MARFSKRKRQPEEEPDINMIPIMNMFMVLIPFLLMSASFFHISAINTSVPVHAQSTPAGADTEKAKQNKKVTVILEIKADRLCLSMLSDMPNDLAQSDKEIVLPRLPDGEIAVTELSGRLRELKQLFPASDTMILIPDDDVSYREIIRAMDCARSYQSETLFTNVVLSGALG